MKKILTLCMSLAMFSATSCSEDKTVVEQLPLSKVEFFVENEAARVEFDGATSTYAWSGNERLGVYINAANPTPNTYADVELRDGRAYCAATTSAYLAGDRMYVYHPFSDVNDGVSLKQIRLVVPSRQSVEVDALNASQVPMVASPVVLGGATPTVYMRPLVGLLRLRVYASAAYAGEKVTSISYTDEQTTMSGEFTIDATRVGGESWGLEGGNAHSVVATLALPYKVGSSKGSASVVYMMLAPNSYSGSLVVTTNKAIYTYEYARDVARNTYYDVNINLSNATSRKSIEGQFGGGDGSASNPYIIDEAADLVALSTSCASASNSYADKHYRQVCDINLSGTSFAPIGSESAPFRGLYDGGNFSVKGIVIASNNSAPCGMFGYLNGATIKRVVVDGFENKGVGGNVGGVAGVAVNSTIENCVMNSDLFAKAPISGGIVGTLNGGKVLGCSTTSTIKCISADADNWGQSGGIAGYVSNGAVIENCTLSGNVASMSKRCGGIVGELQSSTVKNCRVTTTAEVFNNAHSCGGIVGGHYGGTVTGCVVEGTIGSQGDYCGGISGYFSSGEVRDCAVQGSASVITYNDYCGGIVGAAYVSGTNTGIVDGCVSYADVRACHSVGGIAGYALTNATTATVIITNCMAIGGEIFSTGFNENSYSLVGGIVGWSHSNKNAPGKMCYANLCARPKVLRGLSSWITQSSAAGFGGIAGFQNNATNVQMTNLYSDVTSGSISISEAPITSYSLVNYGSLFGPVSSIVLTSGYCIEGIQTVPPKKAANIKGTITTMTMEQMYDGTLLAKLNEGVAANASVEGIALRRWEAGADGYPVIAGLAANSKPATAAPKRVSVIGDSISTFRGYISYNYGAHYPTTDGDLNLVGQTYWWRLIYDHMQNARLERNLAYSGTAVARTTNESYKSQSWYGQDYCTRFINQQGLGAADIVIIHGGTNDYAHNADPLAPGGYAMRSTTCPTDAEFKTMFATAAAATTRAQVEALNDTTFCEAYIKLICLVKERNPKVKIVCIIGDYLTTGIQQSIIKIANHYGARYVDLLSVNGYNDQTYMPKHDYDPSTGKGCHPSAKAMEFIANKIYAEHGTWLEE